MREGRSHRESGATGKRPAAWRKRLLVVGLAAGIQVGLLSLAVFIGVMDPPRPQEAKLKLGPASKALQREREATVEAQLAQLNRMQQASLNQLSEPILEAMQADLPVAAFTPVQAVQAMGAMLPAGSLFQDASGALTDGLEADTLPPPEPVSFLGETLTAKRLVLLLDVSGSVKTKMERAGISMNQLREEVHRFVDQLGPNHLFGIIQFTRKWDPFREELLPATEAVRAEAREWIDTSFRTTGTSGRNWTGGTPNGIEAVLQAAFAMDPQLDEVFIVSDGDFQRTPAGGGGQDVPWPELRAFTKSLQQQSIGEARLRLLCFYPPESALPDLRAWARENGPGSVRIVE
jgi:hypothetical protein